MHWTKVCKDHNEVHSVSVDMPIAHDALSKAPGSDTDSSSLFIFDCNRRKRSSLLSNNHFNIWMVITSIIDYMQYWICQKPAVGQLLPQNMLPLWEFDWATNQNFKPLLGLSIPQGRGQIILTSLGKSNIKHWLEVSDNLYQVHHCLSLQCADSWLTGQ